VLARSYLLFGVILYLCWFTMADYSGVHKRRGGPISQQQKPQPLKGFVSTNPTTVAVANTRTQTQRASNTTPSRAQHRSPASSAMGIKSGMTVEVSV
jgi:hypothetical protein